MPRQRRITEATLDADMARRVGVWAVHFQRAVNRGYRRAQDGTAFTGPLWLELRTWMVPWMVSHHVLAQLAAVKRLAPKLRESRRGLATPFDPAVEFVKRRAQLTDAELAELEPLYSPEALRVMGAAEGYANQEIAKTVAQAVSRGVHVREGVAMLANKHGFAKHLAETVFRTQSRIASVAGRLAVNADPDVDEILWGYRYNATLDARVRPSHAALHDVTLPKDHPRWHTIMPPCGYNCRCEVVEIFKDQRVAVREPESVAFIDGQRVIPGPDDGFDFNPFDVFPDKRRVVA